jgi:hypothetical protein
MYLNCIGFTVVNPNQLLRRIYCSWLKKLSVYQSSDAILFLLHSFINPKKRHQCTNTYGMNWKSFCRIVMWKWNEGWAIRQVYIRIADVSPKISFYSVSREISMNEVLKPSTFKRSIHLSGWSTSFMLISRESG